MITSPTASRLPSLSRCASANRSRGPGLRRRLMLRLVVPASGTGPMAASTATYMSKSANRRSEAMLAALANELSAIAKDRAVRAVVLEANGPGFSGGHDLKELTARRSDADRGRAYFQHVMTTCSAMMLQIVRLPQPV